MSAYNINHVACSATCCTCKHSRNTSTTFESKSCTELFQLWFHLLCINSVCVVRSKDYSCVNGIDCKDDSCKVSWRSSNTWVAFTTKWLREVPGKWFRCLSRLSSRLPKTWTSLIIRPGGGGRGRFRKGKQRVLGSVRGIIMLLKETAKVKAKIEGKSAIALKKESGEVATSRLSV